MAISYKKITELTPLNTSLYNTDVLLIARPGVTDVGYTTYKVLFSTLSSNIINKVRQEDLSVNLITSLVDLSPTAILSGVAGNIGYLLSNDIQTNRGNINSLDSDLTSLEDQFNTFKDNISDTIHQYTPSKVFTNQAPTVWKYNLKTGTSRSPIDMTTYYNQGISIFESTAIDCDTNTLSKGPLVHIITKDCIACISQKGMGSSLYVFTNSQIENTSPLAENLKQIVKTNQSDSLANTWYCIGHFNNEKDILNIPCKKNSSLIFYNDATNTNGDFTPKYTSSFSKNHAIVVREFG